MNYKLQLISHQDYLSRTAAAAAATTTTSSTTTVTTTAFYTKTKDTWYLFPDAKLHLLRRHRPPPGPVDLRRILLHPDPEAERGDNVLPVRQEDAEADENDRSGGAEDEAELGRGQGGAVLQAVERGGVLQADDLLQGTGDFLVSNSQGN